MSGRRILFLHPSDEPYGADRILVTMATGLAARGWAVTVALSDDVPAGWTSSSLREVGIPVRRGPLAPARRRYLQPSGLPGYARRLANARRFIRDLAIETSADVVYANTSTLLVGAVVGRPGGAMLVWHIHEIVTQPRALAGIFRALPVIAADRVIAVSDATARNLLPRSLARRRVVVIHNGIAPTGRPTVARDPSGPIVAYIGRLNRWKGYELFVAAADRALRSGAEATFVMAGSPPIGEEWREAHLAELVSRTSRPHRFRLVGLHPDPPALLAACDILVVPSTSPDPLPTIVLEGMSAGVAIIGASLGGIPEMISDGETGILVPPADEVELARAIERLVQNADARAQMGAAARRRFDRHFVTARFIDDLERALAN